MIDWDRVFQLQQEVGEEDFMDLVDIFLEDAGDAIKKLQPHSDEKGLEASLHYLKGCALNLGLKDLADLCQVGEALARQGKGGDVDIAPIVSCYEKSVGEFMSNINENDA